MRSIKGYWRALLSRVGKSERCVARDADLSVSQVRDLVIPRRQTDVLDETIDKVNRIANVLPEEERSGLLLLVAAAQAGGPLGNKMVELHDRIAKLEAKLEERHTPATEKAAIRVS